MNDVGPIDTAPDPILRRLHRFLDDDTVDGGEAALRRLEEYDEDAGAELTEDDLTELACRIFESRRRRAYFLNVSLLGEPVWDMLLALYCFTAQGKRMSVSSLCYLSGVPQTTALRWLRIMEERGLITRFQDPSDRRHTYQVLAGRGWDLMQRCLRHVHASLMS